MKTFALAAATFGLAISATPALAGPGQGETMKISTAGLDLATPEGQKMLDQRIERAAKSVCKVGDVRTGTRFKSREAKECLTKARASAKRQVATIIEERRRGG
ncbi:MAG: UrcA family protein [Pseudomonadota bacterium]